MEKDTLLRFKNTHFEGISEGCLTKLDYEERTILMFENSRN